MDFLLFLLKDGLKGALPVLENHWKVLEEPQIYWAVSCQLLPECFLQSNFFILTDSVEELFESSLDYFLLLNQFLEVQIKRKLLIKIALVNPLLVLLISILSRCLSEQSLKISHLFLVHQLLCLLLKNIHLNIHLFSIESLIDLVLNLC